MRKTSFINPMKKRGFVDVFSLIVFALVVISIGGVTYVLTQPPKSTDVTHYFVGDILTRHYYQFNCYEKIPQGNRILIESEEIAKQIKFTYGECPK